MAVNTSRIIFITNIGTMFVTYLVYSAIAPFFPDEASSCGLDSFLIGIVMAAFPLGTFFSSLAVGVFLPLVGPKRLMLLGLGCSCVSALLFGAVPYFQCDDTSSLPAFAYFVLFRFIQGLASGITETSILFSISYLFPDNLAQVLSYQEMAIGISCMIGPVVGGLLYHVIHFFYTFVVFSALNAALFLLVALFFPSSISSPKQDKIRKPKEADALINTQINAVDEDLEEATEEKEQVADKQEIGKIHEVMSFDMAFGLTMLFSACMTFAILLPILTLYLDASYGWGPLLAGFVFGGCAFFYTSTAIGVGFVLDNMKVKQTGVYKLSYSIGFAIQAFAFWLLGPVPFQKELVNESTTVIGMALIGFSFGFISIPSLPDCQLCAAVKTGKDTEANKSVVSGLWGATYSLSSVVGGPLGGLLYAKVGFVATSFICAFASIVIGTLSFILGIYSLTKN